jgi:hypothetical protein
MNSNTAIASTRLIRLTLCWTVSTTGFRNLDEFRNGTDPEHGVTLTQVTSSPLNGEQSVSVTRETILRFSNPLTNSATIGPNQLYALHGGRRILSRVEISSDRLKASLFYLEPLPGKRAHPREFRWQQRSRFPGRPVDADGNDVPGGLLAIDFDTVSQTLIPNTIVSGRVFASELAVRTNGATNLSINIPLAGVIITVDGLEETVRATTDQFGDFRLTNAPAGPFFVHIDGRKIADAGKGIKYPELAYYPFVGKLWESTPVERSTLAKSICHWFPVGP